MMEDQLNPHIHVDTLGVKAGAVLWFVTMADYE